MRFALVVTLMTGCLPEAREPAPSPPSPIVTAPAATAPVVTTWWSAPLTKFSGTNGSMKFTIEAPSSLEQQVGVSYRFATDEAQLTVGSMAAWAQGPQTLATYKATLGEGDPIVKETGSELTWSLLIKDHITPDLVTAIFATPVGDAQSRCVWDLPASALKGDTVDGWDVMERACRSIAF